MFRKYCQIHKRLFESVYDILDAERIFSFHFKYEFIRYIIKIVDTRSIKFLGLISFTHGFVYIHRTCRYIV